MKCFKYLLLLKVIVIGSHASAQNIYSKAYGNKSNPHVIFIHGGPRGNSTLFEGTTAQTLADKGFYVIVYDRLGEGRSADPNAKLTYEEAFEDLNTLITQYNLGKVNLIGHSFGGLVSTLYSKAYPEKVSNLILLGALFAQQESYLHILDSCMTKAVEINDLAVQEDISMVRSLDTNSADFRKRTYEIASSFGFFKMPKPTPAAKKLQEEYSQSIFAETNIRNDEAPILFYANETRLNIDTKRDLKDIKDQGVLISAIYGMQDGIFSSKQLQDMRNIVDDANFYAIDNCSHYPFVDQQKIMIDILKRVLR
ncbi:alpha/beta hydrolase [Sphingobacterium oryzagri]|uniref:Alpha/beta hydrolase n=1 Tax=Sphingobacterium oryzagri TaxID=3025669 RepID=A0ABY7WBH6_9SPHI|nr:alpha/beta hydrolase [Sphingobacterium sp. KACC 22765]WDF66800.1 alpha/beta hydrolase [Sphingobacterium sp. KACC 22765]